MLCFYVEPKRSSRVLIIATNHIHLKSRKTKSYRSNTGTAKIEYKILTSSLTVTQLQTRT